MARAAHQSEEELAKQSADEEYKSSFQTNGYEDTECKFLLVTAVCEQQQTLPGPPRALNLAGLMMAETFSQTVFASGQLPPAHSSVRYPVH